MTLLGKLMLYSVLPCSLVCFCILHGDSVFLYSYADLTVIVTVKSVNLPWANIVSSCNPPC